MIQLITENSYPITNLGVKAQRDECRKAEKRETSSSRYEAQQVFKGKICLTI